MHPDSPMQATDVVGINEPGVKAAAKYVGTPRTLPLSVLIISRSIANSMRSPTIQGHGGHIHFMSALQNRTLLTTQGLEIS